MTATTLLDGRYRLHELVGVGGMGRVYRAEHVALERVVAVKVLAPELAHDRELLERFRREAVATSRLAHPNVVGALDFGHDGDQAYFVMEWLTGQPLDGWLAGGPLRPARALHIAAQIASALGAAHHQRIVHRDIKPSNVMRLDGPGDEIKVVDFGLAQLRDRAGRLTQNGRAMGTPAYLAPEQVTGDPIGPAADIYALGGVLYELLTGEPPVGRGEPLALLHRQLAVTPPPPSRVRAELQLAGLDALVMAMLAKAPADRPADGAAAADAIHDVIARLTGSSPARPLATAARAVLVIAVDDDAPPPTDVTIRDAIAGAGGTLARAVGDERFAHFGSSETAVLTAVALSDRLSRWSPRIAVHAGDVQIGSGGGLFGPIVNQALRMVRLARRGDVLVSEPAAAEAGHAVASLLTAHGELQLGAMATPVPLRIALGDRRTAPPTVVGRPIGDAIDFACSCGAITRVSASTDGAVLETKCGRCSQPLAVAPAACAEVRDPTHDLRPVDAIAVEPVSPRIDDLVLAQLANLE